MVMAKIHFPAGRAVICDPGISFDHSLGTSEHVRGA
jgi:hypothetical protein